MIKCGALSVLAYGRGLGNQCLLSGGGTEQAGRGAQPVPVRRGVLRLG